MTWQQASQRLHQQVLDGVPDSLTRALTRLHQPSCEDGTTPICLGCDRDLPGGSGAVWPCRTYTLIARKVLHVSDVEAVLTGLRPKRPPTGANAQNQAADCRYSPGASAG